MQIRAGTFRRQGEGLPPAPVVTETAVTLEKFCEKYAERVGKPLHRNDASCLARLREFDGLGDKPLRDITEDDLEAFFAYLTGTGRAASTMNKYVQAVKAAFRWATKKGYLTRNPAADSEIIKRTKHAKRNRRLQPGEEARLLAAAAPHLQRLIVGALETGCRRGELLSLTWGDVRLDRRELEIRAETTKTKEPRTLPISTRLAAVLEMARVDPTGKEYGPADYVFGELGRKTSTNKRAWQTAVVKAAGQAPVWTEKNALDAASIAAFRATDLHFHDLRHEAGSRFLEAGWPVHHVQHMLGHANLSQTSTYLNATKIGLKESMRRHDAVGCNPIANATAIEQPPLVQPEPPEEPKVVVN
jgi:integrase